jgi:hypothetical protein
MIKTDLVSNLPSGMQERVNNAGSDMEKWLAERKERAKYIKDLSLENESASEDGIEFSFVNEFITGDLRVEISDIAKDFFANCADVCRQVDEKKDELHVVDYFTGDYDKASYGINMIGDQFSLMVIHYLYYGTKLGNEFCKKQLIALHRIFHKKEYNSIKRFSKLTGYDIFDILGDDMSDGSAARIIIISRLLGIEVEKDRNFEIICKLTNKHLREDIPKEKYSKIYDGDYHDEDCESFDHNLFIAKDIVNGYLAAYKKDIATIKSCIRNTAYRYFSVNEKLYNMDIVDKWLRDGSIFVTNTVEAVANALSDPDYEYDYTDPQVVKNASDDERFQMLNELMMASFINFMMQIVFAGNLSAISDNWFLFNDNNHSKLYKPMAADKNVDEDEAKPDDCKPDESDDRADLIAQINELKSQVKMQKSEINSLRGENKKVKSLQRELDKLKYESADDKKELAALRSFVYELDKESETEAAKNNIENMKKVLKNKRLTIIGGHQNLVNYLKQEFPDWTYTATEVRSDIPLSKLVNQDLTVFCAEHICHVFYYKYLHMARKNNLKIGYMQGSNINQIITQLYNQL